MKHKKIKQLRSCGLLMALELDSFDTVKEVIKICLSKGLLSDWFLFAPECLRIAPPLTITDKEIRKACSIIVESLNELAGTQAGKP